MHLNSNNKARTRFYKMIAGENEVQTRLMCYGRATLAWMTDINLSPFKHFNLHLLNHYLMAGSYSRPCTLELALRLSL